MEKMTFDKVALKYRIPLTGVYNAGIFFCLECGQSLDIGNVKNVVGIAEENGLAVMVVECPRCFEKSYSHISDYIYKCFVEMARYPNWQRK